MQHKPKADDLDKKIASKIKKARLKIKMTQQEISLLIGVTYQQYQKYESGLNRISAGRLYRVAIALKRPIQDFYP